MVLERALESLLDCKMQPVNPKGNQHWIFIGRTDAETEALTLATFSSEKTLTPGKNEGRRRRRQQRIRWLDGITNSMDVGLDRLWKFTWSNRQIWPWNTEWSRQRLIEFCQENAGVIANTLFQQHKRRFYTWTSPNGRYENQIDYIMLYG